MSIYREQIETEADQERTRIANEKLDRFAPPDRNYEDELRLLTVAADDVIDAAKYVTWPSRFDDEDIEQVDNFLLALKASVGRLNCMAKTQKEAAECHSRQH